MLAAVSSAWKACFGFSSPCQGDCWGHTWWELSCHSWGDWGLCGGWVLLGAAAVPGVERDLQLPAIATSASGSLPLARFPWRWARSRECAGGRCALSSGCAQSRCAGADVHEADVHRLAGSGAEDVHGPGEGAEGPAGTSCPGLNSITSPWRRAGKGRHGLGLSLQQQHQGLLLRAACCLARRCRFRGTGLLGELPGAGGSWEQTRGLSSSTAGAVWGRHSPRTLQDYGSSSEHSRTGQKAVCYLY